MYPIASNTDLVLVVLVLFILFLVWLLPELWRGIKSVLRTLGRFFGRYKRSIDEPGAERKE